MKILKQAEIVKKFGIVIRLVEYKPNENKNWQETEIKNYIQKYPYWVEHTPLNDDETFSKEHDCWGIFGGSVGMGDSCFKELDKAKEFYQDIIDKTSQEMLEKYPDIWVE